MPPDDNGGLEDDDLPGLDDGQPPPESDLPTEPAETPSTLGIEPSDDYGMKRIFELFRNRDGKGEDDEESAIPELSPIVVDMPGPGTSPQDVVENSALPAIEIAEGWIADPLPMDDPTVRKAITDRIESRGPTPPFRWVFVVGGFGILGLVLAVGLYIGDGDADDTAAAGPSDTPVVETAPPNAEAIVAATDAPAAALDVADPASAVFPPSWNFTATKTKSVIPAPDFISATPMGAQLPWSVAVTESCNADACTYRSVIRPLVPEAVIGDVPEAIWAVNGTKWLLDVTWFSTQSAYGDGTVCVIEKHWSYEFTVTDAELFAGRSVATAFVGTWVQADRLDLAASSGPSVRACGDPWELKDEWSLVGTTG